jgi:hypothetical protein
MVLVAVMVMLFCKYICLTEEYLYFNSGWYSLVCSVC